MNNMIIKILNMARAILASLGSVIVFYPFVVGIPYVLNWIIKIIAFVMFWGNPRYYQPAAFDYQYGIEYYIQFIMTICLGTIIAGSITGLIAGFVAPPTKRTSIAYIISIPFLLFIISCGIDRWVTEHWFYSITLELTYVLTFISYLMCLCYMMVTKYEKLKNQNTGN